MGYKRDVWIPLIMQRFNPGRMKGAIRNRWIQVYSRECREKDNEAIAVLEYLMMKPNALQNCTPKERQASIANMERAIEKAEELHDAREESIDRRLRAIEESVIRWKASREASRERNRYK